MCISMGSIPVSFDDTHVLINAIDPGRFDGCNRALFYGNKVGRPYGTLAGPNCMMLPLDTPEEFVFKPEYFLDMSLHDNAKILSAIKGLFPSEFAPLMLKSVAMRSEPQAKAPVVFHVGYYSCIWVPNVSDPALFDAAFAQVREDRQTPKSESIEFLGRMRQMLGNTRSYLLCYFNTAEVGVTSPIGLRYETSHPNRYTVPAWENANAQGVHVGFPRRGVMVRRDHVIFLGQPNLYDGPNAQRLAPGIKSVKNMRNITLSYPVSALLPEYVSMSRINENMLNGDLCWELMHDGRPRWECFTATH
jgi:hypothetical protein